MALSPLYPANDAAIDSDYGVAGGEIGPVGTRSSVGVWLGTGLGEGGMIVSVAVGTCVLLGSSVNVPVTVAVFVGVCVRVKVGDGSCEAVVVGAIDGVEVVVGVAVGLFCSR